MYKNILVPLENSATDEVIISHIRQLAKLTGAKILLVHVADGFVARNQDQLNLYESDEMRTDRSYLEKTSSSLISEGFSASFILALGDPAKEILKIAESEKCDLIAMATHGHKFLGDLILGTVAETIRHRTNIPILMIKDSREQ